MCIRLFDEADRLAIQAVERIALRCEEAPDCRHLSPQRGESRPDRAGFGSADLVLDAVEMALDRVHKVTDPVRQPVDELGHRARGADDLLGQDGGGQLATRRRLEQAQHGVLGEGEIEGMGFIGAQPQPPPGTSFRRRASVAPCRFPFSGSRRRRGAHVIRLFDERQDVVDEIVGEYAGKLKVAKLNIDENSATPPKYGIRGIPTLMIFKDGDVEATKVGALSKSQLTAFIDSSL